MNKKTHKKKLLIMGLLLLISGIILFAIAAGLALSFASSAEGFPSLLHAFAFALFKSWRLILFILSLIFTLSGCAVLTKLVIYG